MRLFCMASNCVSQFFSAVQTVLNRVNTLTNITYKDDPTIFAWELMNEPRCDADPSGDKIQVGFLYHLAFYRELQYFMKKCTGLVECSKNITFRQENYRFN